MEQQIFDSPSTMYPALKEVHRGSCNTCACSTYQVQTGTKRCRSCGHGASCHVALVQENLKSRGPEEDWSSKIKAAKADKDVSGAVRYVFRNLACWIFATFVGLYMVFQGYELPEFDRGYTKDTYAYTGGIFLISVIYSFISYISSKNEEKRQLGKVLTTWATPWTRHDFGSGSRPVQFWST
ncbi:hypothetical protein BC830DRAFT_147692 [Chytriomyces sp. MP71]|nr:hypothetical protein BC830DRAFT_147692 [Chytriomyces sp. MP71]